MYIEKNKSFQLVLFPSKLYHMFVCVWLLKLTLVPFINDASTLLSPSLPLHSNRTCFPDSDCLQCTHLPVGCFPISFSNWFSPMCPILRQLMTPSSFQSKPSCFWMCKWFLSVLFMFQCSCHHSPIDLSSVWELKGILMSNICDLSDSLANTSTASFPSTLTWAETQTKSPIKSLLWNSWINW